MKTKILSIILVLSVLSVFAVKSYGCGPPPNEWPVAILTAEPEYVLKDEDVTLDGRDSYDPDGSGGLNGIYKFEWDWDYDGNFDADHTENFPCDGIDTHQYTTTGEYTAALRVTDDQGATDTDTCTVYVGIKIYVPDGQPHKDTIQEAIEEAHTSGATVIVKPDTYQGANNRNIDFLGKAITVRSIDPDDPEIVASTIIDCDELGRGFYFHSSEGENSVLDGLTIINGYASVGGGILCDGASPTIKNCIISNNSADRGGGILCDNASPTIKNCVINHNEAHSSSVDVYGGGIYCTNNATPKITSCTISFNLARSSSRSVYGGGISCTNNATPKITSCTISSNSASSSFPQGAYGGGISCDDASPNITNCIFSNNSAGSGGFGGGISCNDASPTITNCIFNNNSAGYGGGIDNGSTSNPEVTNCLFNNNLAYGLNGNGGGMSNYGSSPTVINCTFSGNYADDGGGMYNYNSPSQPTPTVTNCIFWGNEGGEIYDDDGADPTVTYCAVKDGYSPGGVGNINLTADPFADAADAAGPDRIFYTKDDGFILRFESPCVDEGSNSAAGGINTDIMGNTRKGDGDHNSEGAVSATVDMGAYELPKIWFVYGDVQGGNDDGSSWGHAFNDLQDALDLALDIADCNEIWVAKAAEPYKPIDGTNRTKSFVLVQDVPVYGGFEGGEAALKDRDWAANKTILSGDINELGDANDNSFHVVTGVNGGLLDGFTISGGDANGSGLDGYGGGIYCYQTSPTIRNCLIEDNYSEDRGAGMYCFDSDSLVLASCVFRGNKTAGSGAGAFNQYCSPQFTNCLFLENEAEGRGGGGGVKNNYHANPSVINCTFFNNSARDGGGGMCNSQYSSPTVTNCIFFSDTTGGEISNFTSSNPVVTYCAVQGNDPYSPGEGNIALTVNPFVDPFVNSGTPAGDDGAYWTDDDGLRLASDSNCINAANGDVAPPTDILGIIRGIPDYVDIGAYEFPVLMISGGEKHTLLIKEDGTAWACGDNEFSQLGIGDGRPDQSTIVRVYGGMMTTESGYLENIAFIDAGWKHSLAVDNGSYVWAWGKNDYGQIGDGSTARRTTPVKVVGGQMGTDRLEGIVKVAAGRSGQYSLACDKSQSRYVWAWGRNDKGQLGNNKHGDGEKETEPNCVLKGQMSGPETYLENIIDIDAGISHSIALDNTEDRNVWCWGYNSSGQLGNGSEVDDDEPVQVEDGNQTPLESDYLEDIVDVAVSCGLSGGIGLYGSSYAVEGNGNGYVWAWGSDRYGKLGDDGTTNQDKNKPVQVKGEGGSGNLNNIIAISAGDNHVLALEDMGHGGKVFAWGDNYYGQLGNGESGFGDSNSTPVRVKIDSTTDLTDIVYIDAGFEHSTAIDKDGNIWVWGRNQKGQLGLGEYSDPIIKYAEMQ